jgi:hypothetical protein
MSWLSLAASLLRDAMSSEPSPPPVRAPSEIPPDVAGIVDYVNNLRAETEKNFGTVAQMLQAQNEQLPFKPSGDGIMVLRPHSLSWPSPLLQHI